MSGRTVLILPLAHPAVLLPAGLGAGVAALGAGLAVGVKKLVEGRIAAAHREREAEKASNEVWRAFENEQRQQARLFQALEQAVHASEKSLASLQLAAPAAEAHHESAEAEAALDFAAIGAERDPAVMQQMANEIEALLDKLPAEFKDAEGSPFTALVRQAKHLTADLQKGRKVRPAELAAFKGLVTDTLTDFANEFKAQERQRQEFAARIAHTLDDLLFYEHLLHQHEVLLADPLADELASIREQLNRLVASTEIRTAHLALLEKKLEDVRSALESRVLQLAQRDGLCESVARNLADMGYKMIAEFGPESGDGAREATFRVPGGERVKIDLHQNNQLGMQLFHERIKGKRGPLSEKEQAFVKKQETRWCADFKELVRRLVAEGFPYEISVEDQIPDGAVKVVVVETPEDVLAQEAMQQETTTPRYLDQT